MNQRFTEIISYLLNIARIALTAARNGLRLVSESASNAAKCVAKRCPRVRRVGIAVVSAVLVVAVVLSIVSVTGLTYALEVSVYGDTYGCVSSAAEADAAINMLQSEVETVSEPEAEYNYKLTASSAVVSADELYNEIVDSSDALEIAALVYVDGKLFASASSVAAAEATLASIAGENSFFNDIEIKESAIESALLETLPTLEGSLEATAPTIVTYTVASGDTAESIAEKFSVSPVLVEALNTSASFAEGNELNIVVELPVFAVVTTSQRTVTAAVAAGVYGNKAGKVSTTYTDTAVGGIVYKSEISASDFSEYNVDKPVASSVRSVGRSGFCWPVDPAYKNYISSYWGDGRGHRAVDIACKVGTPVLSALSGTVVSVNSSGAGYGLHFVVDHGNGLKTLYAHCSKLYVTVGDRVERGEVVALSGMTGRSTGPHLHFEVLKNGAKVNPCSYLGI